MEGTTMAAKAKGTKKKVSKRKEGEVPKVLSSARVLNVVEQYQIPVDEFMQAYYDIPRKGKSFTVSEEELAAAKQFLKDQDTEKLEAAFVTSGGKPNPQRAHRAVTLVLSGELS